MAAAVSPIRAILTCLLILSVAASWCSPCPAAEPPSFVNPAAQAQAAVVTVRVSPNSLALTRLRNTKLTNEPVETATPGKTDKTETASTIGTADAGPEKQTAVAPQVTVCTGICVRDGLIVSSFFAGTDSRIRLTLPGGEQATARLAVIDEYSSLVLLTTDSRTLRPLQPAPVMAAVGEWVMAASGWGVEPPVVSAGIVSGLERTIQAGDFPPLLHCGIGPSETSSGGPIVDAKGKLLGVVVLADKAERQQGMYAVPVRHVQRLLRVYGENKKVPASSVIVLKRRRPIVGMVLSGNPDQVKVARVSPGGPADKAGIQVGDRVLAANGIKIRSVYQALQGVLQRQPGDEVTFTVEQGDQVQIKRVVLAGDVALPRAELRRLAKFVEPKINMQLPVPLVPLPINPAIIARPDDLEARPVSETQKIELLEKALDRYRGVIAYQQSVLSKQYQEQLQTDKTLKTMKVEIDKLKRQLDTARKR